MIGNSHRYSIGQSSFKGLTFFLSGKKMLYCILKKEGAFVLAVSNKNKIKHQFEYSVEEKKDVHKIMSEYMYCFWSVICI